jgi:DNA-binding FadR family transcriptional regulator
VHGWVTTIPFVGDGRADVLAEAIEACEIIEGDLAGRAAERRSAGDLAALSEALDALLATVGDPRAFVVCDLVLRERIAAASRCRHLVRVLGVLHQALLESLVGVAEQDQRGRCAVEQAASRVRLVEVIVRGDGAAARRAVESIFDHLRTGLVPGGGSPNGDLERVRAM